MQEWYECPYCGIRLPTWDILQGHIAVEHPPEPPPPPPPPPPPEPEPPPVIHIGWIDSIFSFVWDIADWFFAAYLETKGWWVIGPLFSGICYGIYKVVWSLLAPIADFGAWADDIATKVVNVFTADGILGLIKWWFPWLYNVGEWFYNRWQWFTTAVGNWWDSTKTTVLGWIAIATEGFNALLVWWDEFWKITWPQWMATLEVFQSKVDDFFKNTLPGLFDVEYAALWWTVKLLGIEDLIDTAFLTRQDFWEGWQDLKAMVVKFYQDPLEFLWELFTDWFLGPEE